MAIVNNINFAYNLNNQNYLHANDALHSNNVRNTNDVITRFCNNSSITDGMTANPNLLDVNIPYYYSNDATAKGVTQNIQKKKNGKKKIKRIRMAYQSDQIEILEKQYTNNRYIDRERKLELAEQFNVSHRHITTWFQNRRMKEKKKAIDEASETEATLEAHEHIDNNYLHTNHTSLNNYYGEVRMTSPNITSNINAALSQETPLLLNPINEHYNVNPIRDLKSSVWQQLRENEYQHQSNVQHLQYNINPICTLISCPPYYRQAVDFRRSQMAQRKPYQKIQQPYFVPNRVLPTNIHQDQMKATQSQNVHQQKTSEQFLRSPVMLQQFHNRRGYFKTHQCLSRSNADKLLEPSNLNIFVPEAYKKNNQTSPKISTTEYRSSPYSHDHPSAIAISDSNKTETKRPKPKCNKDNIINFNARQTFGPSKEVITVQENKNVHYSDNSDNDNLKQEVQQIKEEHPSADEHYSYTDIDEPEVKNNITLDDITIVSHYSDNRSRNKNSLLSRLVFEDD